MLLLNKSLLLADGLGSGDVGSGDFQMGKLLGASCRPPSCPLGKPQGRSFQSQRPHLLG